MREVLRSGAIGQITHIQAQLGIDHRPLNQNAKSKEPGGGALLSLGENFCPFFCNSSSLN